MARRTKKTAPEEPGLFDAPKPAEDASRQAVSRDPGPPQDTPQRHATVSELTGQIKSLLAGAGRVSVEGELSGFKRHTSGHIYFDLKDSNARLSCVIWRSRRAQALRFDPTEGAQVVAHGKLDVYAPRGNYSLIVERLEPVGVGALLLQFEELKRELESLGWFERKRPLPVMPDRVGVVTSRDGAALRDFLRTRSMRWPAYPVRLVHTAVQGPGASESIADAIDRMDASGVDVIVVCRGGGSLEDLWAFNERPVAEAIRRASVPVVTGVGHESDTTLADLVADHRAHTPTDAAQAVFPDRAARVSELERLRNYLIGAMGGELERRAERLRSLAQRPSLASAHWILGHRRQSLDENARRLHATVAARIERYRTRLATLEARITRQSPESQLVQRAGRLGSVGTRLFASGAHHIGLASNRMQLAAQALEGYSPLAVLARGYSVTRGAEGAPLVHARDVAIDDQLETRLSRGSIVSRVVEVRRENDGDST